jgi:phenylalanyl-tRNA synthetase beta chain
MPLAAREIRYQPLRKYPTSGFDLSLITSLETPVDKIQDELTSFAGKDLASIEFVRQYVGTPLQPGQKSVTYQLRVGALDHTLSAEEVAAIRNRITAGMRASGYEFRG